MLGPPCLTPQRWSRPGQTGRMHAHHTSRQPSPARLLVALSACDHGLIPAFRVPFPSGPGGSVTQPVGSPRLASDPAALGHPTPALFGSTHGQLSTGQTDDIADPQTITTDFRASSLRRESSFVASPKSDIARERRHFKASDNSSIQSTGMYTLSSYTIASDQVVARCLFPSRLVCLHLFSFFALNFFHVC